MTRYNKSMREVLFSIREGYSPKEIKMAIGIANDPRYKGGNYDGAVDAIEKIKKGLSNHKQVAAVLKRLNTGFEQEGETLDEALPPHLAKLFDKDGNFKDPKKQKVFDRMMGDGIGKEIAQKMGRIKFRVQADSAKKKVMVYVDQNDESDAQKALKNHPAYVSGALRVIPEEVELEEAMSKDMALKILSMTKNQDFKIGSGDRVPMIYLSNAERDELKKEFGRLGRDVPGPNKGATVMQIVNLAHSGNDRKPFDTEGGKHMISWNKGGKKIGTPKNVGDAAKLAGLRLEEVELEEKLGKDADAGDYIDDFKKSDAPQFKGKSDKKKRDMAIAAYLDAKDKKEEVDEGMKYTHAAVDKKGLVIGFASDEKDAKDMAKRNDGKVVKLKKPMSDKKGDMMVNRPLKEEEPDKPDTAKAVDQMRDDKKKTRIAQLQLQIAKATEMINKLNAQEKPSE